MVISGAVIATVLLYGGKDESLLIRDSAWLDENIWQVKSYKPREDGQFDVRLLEVEQAYETGFDKLYDTFINTPYSAFNSYCLKDGVGCQGMVCYIASWCERTAHAYSVAWNTAHVWIYVKYETQWYLFDFGPNGPIFKEVKQSEVEKGMVLE